MSLHQKGDCEALWSELKTSTIPSMVSASSPLTSFGWDGPPSRWAASIVTIRVVSKEMHFGDQLALHVHLTQFKAEACRPSLPPSYLSNQSDPFFAKLRRSSLHGPQLESPMHVRCIPAPRCRSSTSCQYCHLKHADK